MRTFTVSTEGTNRLALRELCQRYVDEQWVADDFTDEQAAESLLEKFKRAVRAESELLTIAATSAVVHSATQSRFQFHDRWVVDNYSREPVNLTPGMREMSFLTHEVACGSVAG